LGRGREFLFMEVLNIVFSIILIRFGGTDLIIYLIDH